MKRNQLFVLTAITGLFAASAALASPFSDRLKQNAQDAKDRAAQQAAAAKQHALEEANRLLAIAALDGVQLEMDVIHDVMAGKKVLVDELVCSVRNIKDNTSISGAIQIKGAIPDSKLALKLSKLLGPAPDDSQKRDLGIEYRMKSTPDGPGFDYRLLDLRHPDEALERSITLSSLGLDTDCSQHRKLLYMRDGVLMVDKGNLQSTIDDNSRSVKDVKAIGQDPKTPVLRPSEVPGYHSASAPAEPAPATQPAE
ncbi:MAG: hypothetical protein HY074_13415 [Deltaproteobacteria bacterium]|nr:hypothetical protein [Deltaproteobacteria bacterium]